MTPFVDLAIIGAGPSGMACASQAAECGLSVILIDEQASAGGQIYRDIERAADTRGDILGKDYVIGKSLVAGLQDERVKFVRGAKVWQIETASRVTFSVEGRSQAVRARRLVIATGALERPMPLPGWTLPGVLTAGAAQILLKQSSIVCRDAVLVGSGPLLYLVAAQLCRVGRPPIAIVETQTLTDLLRASRNIGGALVGWRYLLKGLGLLRELRAAGVRRYRSAREIEVLGDQSVSGIRFSQGSQTRELQCQTVLLHHGVIPNTQIARSLDVTHLWDDRQECFRPEVDEWGRSNIDTIFIAGDGAGIGGAKVAALRGQMAALEIAKDLGLIAESKRAAKADAVRKNLIKENAARPFIDLAYPPFRGALQPSDDVIVCRCEEVTAGEIRGYAKLGCLGPNQAKAFGRSGMGPCQGRYCGTTVTRLLADANDRTPDETGYFRIRAPLKPVSLGEVADLHNPDYEEKEDDPAY